MSTPGNICRYDALLLNNDSQKRPFMELNPKSPMLNFLDAFFFDSIVSCQVMRPSTYRNAEAIFAEKAAGHEKDWYLVSATTIAYVRSLVMLSVFPNASVAENWGGLGNYFETILEELKGYDDSGLFRTHLQTLLKAWFRKFPTPSSGKSQQSCQGPTPSRGVKRASFIPSAEDRESILQAIDRIEDEGELR